MAAHVRALRDAAEAEACMRAIDAACADPSPVAKLITAHLAPVLAAHESLYQVPRHCHVADA